ncbi:rhodanese-like domain-containing protein [Thalassomonas actiniarum]|uniref:Rhodanese-like domain-containing protein n=1 Tax=Thalassomonas actiniarum TaxID=485447 RepID=A0AAE9YR96_9GAMM|nr:rhodanese-like domain-containing protein [Thalassomonas actiniarum]WDD99222.1 rhodanese-like domain-containing protein [Thalassomonas actiniarum]
MIINGKALAQTARKHIKEISCQQLVSQLTQTAVIIDIRESTELESGTIPGAVHIPRGVLEMQIATHPMVAGEAEPLAKLAQQDIYLYCQSGARSALAALSLQQMGFERVYSLGGGFNAWQQTV